MKVVHVVKTKIQLFMELPLLV